MDLGLGTPAVSVRGLWLQATETHPGLVKSKASVRRLRMQTGGGGVQSAQLGLLAHFLAWGDRATLQAHP